MTSRVDVSTSTCHYMQLSRLLGLQLDSQIWVHIALIAVSYATFVTHTSSRVILLQFNSEAQEATEDEEDESSVSNNYELDIQLTLRDAQAILEQLKSSSSSSSDDRRQKRKVKDDSLRWELLIKYTFDGTHCEYMYVIGQSSSFKIS